MRRGGWWRGLASFLHGCVGIVDNGRRVGVKGHRVHMRPHHILLVSNGVTDRTDGRVGRCDTRGHARGEGRGRRTGELNSFLEKVGGIMRCRLIAHPLVGHDGEELGHSLLEASDFRVALKDSSCTKREEIFAFEMISREMYQPGCQVDCNHKNLTCFEID